MQLAKRRGAGVIAATTEEKAEQVLSLGAARTISRNDRMASTLGEDSVDVVVDLVGGSHWPELLDILRPHGRYAASGAIAGPIVSLDLRKLYLKDLTLFGCTVYEQAVFDDLLGYIERGEIKPVIARQFALKDIVEAQKAFLGKRFVGKIVLVP